MLLEKKLEPGPCGVESHTPAQTPSSRSQEGGQWAPGDFFSQAQHAWFIIKEWLKRGASDSYCYFFFDFYHYQDVWSHFKE